MKPSKKWWKKAEVYRWFAEETYGIYTLDFSDSAASAMYEYESTGKGNLEGGIFTESYNGYFYGKKALDLAVTEWRDGCYRGLSTHGELREDLEENAPPAVLAWFDDLPMSTFAPSAAVIPDFGESTRTFLERHAREAWARLKAARQVT